MSSKRTLDELFHGEREAKRQRAAQTRRAARQKRAERLRAAVTLTRQQGVDFRTCVVREGSPAESPLVCSSGSPRCAHLRSHGCGVHTRPQKGKG